VPQFIARRSPYLHTLSRHRSKLIKSQKISSLFRHTLVQNALSLYGVQIATYVVPLVTIPYLARVLGAAGWGLVAFAQAFGSWVALVGEYGFSLSGTREIARHRDDPEKMTQIVAGVLGAKTLLAVASIVTALGAFWFVPIFRQHPRLLLASVVWASAQVFNMIWVFQGLERMRFVAALDISAKVVATVLVFLVVHRPEDGWRVLVVQGLGFGLSSVICMRMLYRLIPFRMPNRVSVSEALRMGWSMFLFRSSVSLYTTANVFILGLFVSPQLVGYYAGAEKVSRGFLGLLNPLNQTLYPRLSHLVHHAQNRAARLARIAAVLMGAASIALAALIFFAAPLLVRVILGHDFQSAVPIVRILSALVPLVACGNVLGLQWMLPLGMDRAFNKIILTAGFINLFLALILAPRFKDMGMAWAVVIAEAFVSVSMYLCLRSQKLDPLSYPASSKEKTTSVLEFAP
jgi:polysaccharide transporter, PST family